MSDEEPEKLSAEIAKAKAAYEARTAPKQRGPALNPSSAGAQTLRHGAEFGASVIVGIVLGLAIDAFFGTRPWGILIMLGFGIAAGVRNMVRAYRQLTAAASNETDAPQQSSDEQMS